MRRKTFDILMSVGGLVLALVLAVAGGLLLWAHNFVTDEVHSQLAAQKIYFPQAGSEALQGDQIAPYLNQYAGQQLVNGEQAKAYADHFIAVHLQGIGGGQTYSQLSAKAMASPNDQALAGQVQTMFRGETLRSMLLNAYAFWKMGQIALIAGVVSFVAAFVFLILSIFGFVHAGGTSETQELKLGARTPAPVEP
jgi:hypothetical protein